MSKVFLLHSNFLNIKEVQWGTKDEKSFEIEAMFVKVHDIHPMKGEYRMISKLIN